MNSTLSQLVAGNEQGELQGGVASMQSVAAIIGPPVLTARAGAVHARRGVGCGSRAPPTCWRRCCRWRRWRSWGGSRVPRSPAPPCARRSRPPTPLTDTGCSAPSTDAPEPSVILAISLRYSRLCEHVAARVKRLSSARAHVHTMWSDARSDARSDASGAHFAGAFAPAQEAVCAVVSKLDSRARAAASVPPRLSRRSSSCCCSPRSYRVRHEPPLPAAEP